MERIAIAMQDGGTGAGAQHGDAGREANLILSYRRTSIWDPRGGGTFWFQIFIQAPSPEIWRKTISGGEGGCWRGKWGGLFWATSLEEIIGGVIAMISFRPGRWMQQSAVPRCAILSVRSTGRHRAVKRRDFITLVGGAAAAWPIVARAQQPAMPVIGYFSGRSPEAEAPIRVPFLKALEGSGFAVERNITIEYRFAEGQDDRLPALAAELIRRQVAMLVATDRPSASAAKAATATIPIVFTSGFDPVRLGLVASFS